MLEDIFNALKLFKKLDPVCPIFLKFEKNYGYFCIEFKHMLLAEGFYGEDFYRDVIVPLEEYGWIELEEGILAYALLIEGE